MYNILNRKKLQTKFQSNNTKSYPCKDEVFSPESFSQLLSECNRQAQCSGGRDYRRPYPTLARQLYNLPNMSYYKTETWLMPLKYVQNNVLSIALDCRMIRKNACMVSVIIRHSLLHLTVVFSCPINIVEFMITQVASTCSKNLVTTKTTLVS